MSRHRSSVGPRWPSKRIAALHRLPIRSVLAARCALRCAPMAARSLRHLIGDATLVKKITQADLHPRSLQRRAELGAFTTSGALKFNPSIQLFTRWAKA
ncbi:hypothetical protein D5045_23670 [Verminephrobacter eiseniae]|uniref:hypothetical protein n=1 Tax=Verminephrobacter eiseniae TaxID=364317 RepID=UPI002237645F|nr:hypothetical protein [Verminephrobacter eiseniae]MCW5263027.1 hypothetical protein [Verminephrobacter eiseniae]